MTAARPRPAEAPRPLGEMEQQYYERALLACLLSDPASTLKAVKEAGLRRSDVSAALAAVIDAVRDILGAGEPVTVEALASTLRIRRAEAPADFGGWHSFLTSAGLSDHDPGRWARALRARVLRRRLPAAAQAVAERYPGSLDRLAALVEELKALGGAS